jgi:hypothetical protein
MGLIFCMGVINSRDTLTGEGLSLLFFRPRNQIIQWPNSIHQSAPVYKMSLQLDRVSQRGQ